MIDAVAGGRRSALVLAVVASMMIALFTACCCLELDHASAADPLPAAAVAAHPGASQEVTVGRDGGHTEQGCQESVATVAVAPAAMPGPRVAPAAVAGAPMAGQTSSRAGAHGPGAPLPPPDPHLLCVMRT